MASAKSRRNMKWWSGRLLGSRIARLIFASNLAGLIILIIGAMVLCAVIYALGDLLSFG